MQNSNTQREQKLIKNKKVDENSRFWKSLFLLEKSSLNYQVVVDVVLSEEVYQ